jgi:hypothetical protein
MELATDIMAIWREEFISINRTKRDTSFFDGRFLDDRTEILFHGFLIAKRNMPVIEIPAYDMINFAPVRNLIAQFESVGIKYTIKGE